MRTLNFQREIRRYINKKGPAERRGRTSALAQQTGVRPKTLENWVLGRGMPTRKIQLRVLELLAQLNA